MKIRDKRHYSDDPEQLKFWAEEIEFIGRPYRLDLKRGVLTVFARPPRKNKKKKNKETRNKRAESAGRHNS
jgi:hypothetical protein